MIQEVHTKQQQLISEFHRHDYELVTVCDGREIPLDEFDLVRLHQGGLLEIVRLDPEGHTREVDFRPIAPGEALRVRRRARG